MGKLRPGLVQNDLSVTGYAQSAGDTEHRYKISYFSGTNSEKVLITEGVFTNTLTAPEPPKIVNANTRWGASDWKNGFEPVNHDPNASLRRVKVFVESRNYNQRIDFDGVSDNDAAYCLIEEGAESCEIETNMPLRGSHGQNEFQGELNQFVSGNSVNQYYDPTDYSELITLKWDYRPPVIESTVFNTSGKGEALTHEVDGDIVTIPENEAIVIVGSPHVSLTSSDWWKPAGVSLSLTPDKDLHRLRSQKLSMDIHCLPVDQLSMMILINYQLMGLQSR